MQYRTLGRTGIKVSPYALGALMLGTSVGNADHDDSVRIIHKALDAGINFLDTADRTATPRWSSGRRSRDAATASSSRPSSAARRATTPTNRAPPGAGSSPRSRTRCAACRPTTSTSTRSTGRTPTPTSRRRFPRSPT